MTWGCKIYAGSSYSNEANLPNPARDEIAEDYGTNIQFVTLHDGSSLRIIPEHPDPEPVPIVLTWIKQKDEALFTRLCKYKHSGSLLLIVPHIGQNRAFFSGSFTKVRRVWPLKYTGDDQQYYNIETEFSMFNIEEAE